MLSCDLTVSSKGPPMRSPVSMPNAARFSPPLHWAIACFIFTLYVSPAVASEPSPFVTPVRRDSLDPAAFAQWCAGQETAISAEAARQGAQEVLWTADSRPEWRGVEFGTERTAGVRHLRLGVREPIRVGTLLVRGGAVPCVLKADAAYPGDLANDSLWTPAERLPRTSPSSREDYDIWVLPANTNSRAIRFTHLSAPADTNPAGWLGGVALLSDRMANVAPQGAVFTASRPEAASRLIDQTNDRQWMPWDNGEKGGPVRISPEHPEIITVTWPEPVRLRGLCLLWAGMGAADVQAYVGKETKALQRTPDADWATVGSSDSLDPLYPLPLGTNWIDFHKEVVTPAIRLRITKGSSANHPHIADRLKEGKLVWLGELMALTPLTDAPLATALLKTEPTETPPPIPVRFKLDRPGLVTLVIEDSQGTRVRNLVSETPFPAGDNVVWWDGSDDLLRDPDAARHGLYSIPSRAVAPGRYRVHGLVRKPLTLTYQQSIYSAGKPAWETADKTGCWMTNHTPPTSIACVPAGLAKVADGAPLVFMGAFVAEGGHGLQWVKENGGKVGGQGWVGGNWTGAPTLAFDRGSKRVADHLCYAASIWEGELRITAKTPDLRDKPIVQRRLGDDPSPDRRPKDQPPVPVLEEFDGGDRQYVLAGTAAYDGLIACSLIRQNEVQLIRADSGEVERRLTVTNPRGVAFDRNGHLLVLSEKSLLRFTDPAKPTPMISTGLEDPRHVAVDEAGALYITDRGTSHQVKIFTPTGEPKGAIGKPGAPAVGPYDPLHLNNPNGLGIDSEGRVWVAEDDFHPKRVSVWSPGGELLNAYYGPGEYGGGGVLDSADPKRFFYKGLEFALDREHGADRLVRVFYRPSPLLQAHYGPFSPDTPLYPSQQPNVRYFTSCFTHNPTNGDQVSFLWRDADGKVSLVAALGSPHDWAILKTDPFRPRWPEGVDPTGDRWRNPAAFAWTDANADGLPQPDEVQMTKVECAGVINQTDLSFVVARFGEKTVRFPATGFTAHGAPQYDLSKPEILLDGAQSPTSSGGDQAMTNGGWTIHTVAPKPFSPYGLGGSFHGQARWTYPNVWPGLHASHEAAVPDRPGMVIGTTRLLGGWIRPTGEAGPLFAINANMGNMYLFTADGLFVATLFHDIRLRPNWAMPTAEPGMDVSNVSLHDENFWPSITQTASGEIYLVDGARVSLVRVDELDSIHRFEGAPVNVTTDDLAACQNWLTQREAARQSTRGTGRIKVALRASAPTVDGQLEDWPASTDWAVIDRRGTRANFDSNSKPYDASAALAISGDSLFIVWKTNEKDLLRNSGETPLALFKTGGALDLMLATNPAAPADRRDPVPGDQRLLITLVDNQPQARLYRARVPGTPKPVPFSSPWRTINLDQVEDVSKEIQLAAGGEGAYEVRVPLKLLGWTPSAGQSYRGDVGLLRGDGRQTTQRVYWSNKATAITSDVPSEAELLPRLWGEFAVENE
jgi:hypothetical protein